MDDEPDATLSLWEGDEGRLTEPQRRTLVALLRNRYLSADRHPSEWRCLQACETLLRGRLNDVFMLLHVDPSAGIAYKQPAFGEDGTKFPTLLHDAAYTREETILLMFARQRHLSERLSGREDVLIDVDDLLAHVEAFRPEHATNQSGDRKRTENAIEALRRAGVFARTADEARVRILPVIETLLPLDKLHQLSEWLAGAAVAGGDKGQAADSGWVQDDLPTDGGSSDDTA
jgi:hypothetical protein